MLLSITSHERAAANGEIAGLTEAYQQESCDTRLHLRGQNGRDSTMLCDILWDRV